MKFSFRLFVLTSAAVLFLSHSRANAQAESDDPGPLAGAAEAAPLAPIAESQAGECCDSTIQVRRFRGVCSDCGERHGIANGRIRGAISGANGSLAAMAHSGQPLVDPWMRADWIAQQRAATSSWHAGYYHTQWGAPVALMVPPTVRAHTRWSWGVAQSTVMPLYHQFERPYPGPAMGAQYGDPSNPLRPTPPWPSHTDQFGVYYIRGPW
jgi:hypothetical protein